MTGLIDIGDVARRSGVAVSTLHVRERHGLITPVARAGLRRQYRDDVLRRLDQAIDGIRHALGCPRPSPLTCPGLIVELDTVLPVTGA